MIKLLVSDLDGTFIMSKPVDGKIVSKENTEAIHRFIEQGGRFVTCSGRHHEFSYELMEELGFTFDMIGINGATLVHNNCLIEHNNPRRHYIRKVVEELSKEEYKDQLAIICIDLNNNFILGDPNSWVRARFENALRVGKINSISDKPLLDYLNDRKCYDVTSLHVNVKDPNTLHDWIHKLREMFDQHFDIYASGPINIEFMKPGINKGHGVRSIMKLYGLEEHEIAVAGDNQNDISMFFTTNNSYCMSTATPQVQKYAHKVVDSVAEAIEDILRKNELERIRKEFD